MCFARDIPKDHVKHIVKQNGAIVSTKYLFSMKFYMTVIGQTFEDSHWPNCFDLLGVVHVCIHARLISW